MAQQQDRHEQLNALIEAIVGDSGIPPRRESIAALQNFIVGLQLDGVEVNLGIKKPRDPKAPFEVACHVGQADVEFRMRRSD